MLTHTYEKPTPPDRVVVMGGAGFVGGAIVRALQAKGIAVRALTRRDVDLLAPDAAERLAALLQPSDALVAVSAIAPVKTPAMLKDNITLAEAIASAVRSRPVAHLLNIGSDAIYADRDGPLDENACKAPGSLHGIMHLAREVMLAEAAGATPFATLRPTLIYGAEDPHNGYGPNRFRRLAAEGKDIVLFGEGEERRDHVLIDDVAELAVRILLHRSRGALNAATGMVISFRECAEQVVSHLTGRQRSKARRAPAPCRTTAIAPSIRRRPAGPFPISLIPCRPMDSPACIPASRRLSDGA
jgi:UDP-glucose 4-epimerase